MSGDRGCSDNRLLATLLTRRNIWVPNAAIICRHLGSDVAHSRTVADVAHAACCRRSGGAPHLRPRSPASTEKLLLVDYSDPGEKLSDQPERVGSGGIDERCRARLDRRLVTGRRTDRLYPRRRSGTNLGHGR